MINRVRAVIFDWAGTVVDYGCFAPMHAFIQTFEESGISITVKEARGPMGLLKRDHIQAILDMDRVKQVWVTQFSTEPKVHDVERLYERFELHLMDALPHYTDPLPGVVDTVGLLRENGLKVGSTTGYTRKMMRVVHPKAKSKGYEPDFVVSADEVKVGRPAPDMIFRNLTELEVYPPQAAVKVGDTVADVREGKNAGVWSIAVIKGSSELGLTKQEVDGLDATELQGRMDEVRKRFEEAGADFVLSSIAQLPEAIDLIQSRV